MSVFQESMGTVGRLTDERDVAIRCFMTRCEAQGVRFAPAAPDFTRAMLGLQRHRIGVSLATWAAADGVDPAPSSVSAPRAPPVVTVSSWSLRIFTGTQPIRSAPSLTLSLDAGEVLQDVWRALNEVGQLMSGFRADLLRPRMPATPLFQVTAMHEPMEVVSRKRAATGLVAVQQPRPAKAAAGVRVVVPVQIQVPVHISVPVQIQVPVQISAPVQASAAPPPAAEGGFDVDQFFAEPPAGYAEDTGSGGLSVDELLASPPAPAAGAADADQLLASPPAPAAGGFDVDQFWAEPPGEYAVVGAPSAPPAASRRAEIVAAMRRLMADDRLAAADRACFEAFVGDDTCLLERS